LETPRTMSAGIVPVFRTEDGGHLYLLLRSFTYWDFPKGGLRSGEPPLEAAMRELREETTLENAQLTWGQIFLDTPPYSRGKVARYYIGEVKTQKVDTPVNPEIGRAEHHEFRWVSYKEARDLLGDRVRRILDWAEQIITSKPSNS